MAQLPTARRIFDLGCILDDIFAQLYDIFAHNLTSPTKKIKGEGVVTMAAQEGCTLPFSPKSTVAALWESSNVSKSCSKSKHPHRTKKHKQPSSVPSEQS